MNVVLLALLACDPNANRDSGTTADTESDTANDTAADTSNDTAPDTGEEDTDTGESDPDLWVRVDGAGDVQQRSVDVAVAQDGTAYVSWVDSAAVAWVSRSIDGAMTWGEAAAVNLDGSAASVAMARRPYVVADGERVAVAFVDLGTGLVLAYAAPADTLDFQSVATLGVTANNNDFAKPLFADGDLLVEWQTYDATGAMVLARESTNWAEEPVDDTIPGVPCECCPNDALAVSTGEVMVAFRNNDNDIREHWVSMSPSGTTSVVSDTEGELDVCPMQGPRLGEVDGTLMMVWADASMAGSTWIASSEDGGRSWSSETDVLGRTGTGSPTVATSNEGDVIVTAETGLGSVFAVSSDGGMAFGAPEALVGPSGELGFAQVESGGDVVLVAGSSSDGSAWVYRGSRIVP